MVLGLGAVVAVALVIVIVLARRKDQAPPPGGADFPADRDQRSGHGGSLARLVTRARARPRPTAATPVLAAISGW